MSISIWILCPNQFDFQKIKFQSYDLFLWIFFQRDIWQKNASPAINFRQITINSSHCDSSSQQNWIKILKNLQKSTITIKMSLSTRISSHSTSLSFSEPFSKDLSEFQTTNGNCKSIINQADMYWCHLRIVYKLSNREAKRQRTIRARLEEK